MTSKSLLPLLCLVLFILAALASAALTPIVMHHAQRQGGGAEKTHKDENRHLPHHHHHPKTRGEGASTTPNALVPTWVYNTSTDANLGGLYISSLLGDDDGSSSSSKTLFGWGSGNPWDAGNINVVFALDAATGKRLWQSNVSSNMSCELYRGTETPSNNRNQKTTKCEVKNQGVRPPTGSISCLSARHLTILNATQGSEMMTYNWESKYINGLVKSFMMDASSHHSEGNNGGHLLAVVLASGRFVKVQRFDLLTGKVTLFGEYITERDVEAVVPLYGGIGNTKNTNKNDDDQFDNITLLVVTADTKAVANRTCLEPLMLVFRPVDKHPGPPILLSKMKELVASVPPMATGQYCYIVTATRSQIPGLPWVYVTILGNVVFAYNYTTGKMSYAASPAAMYQSSLKVVSMADFIPEKNEQTTPKKNENKISSSSSSHDDDSVGLDDVVLAILPSGTDSPTIGISMKFNYTYYYTMFTQGVGSDVIWTNKNKFLSGGMFNSVVTMVNGYNGLPIAYGTLPIPSSGGGVGTAMGASYNNGVSVYMQPPLIALGDWGSENSQDKNSGSPPSWIGMVNVNWGYQPGNIMNVWLDVSKETATCYVSLVGSVVRYDAKRV